MLILLIDDDFEDHETFCDALAIARPNAKCITATDGKSALKLLEDLTILPDQIFLDLNMPLMNGKDFFESFIRNPQYSRIPVVIYSTTSNSRDYDVLKKMGADKFLTKPSRFDDLIRILQEHLVD